MDDAALVADEDEDDEEDEEEEETETEAVEAFIFSLAAKHTTIASAVPTRRKSDICSMLPQREANQLRKVMMMVGRRLLCGDSEKHARSGTQGVCVCV